jgi:hypothetical protein
MILRYKIKAIKDYYYYLRVKYAPHQTNSLSDFMIIGVQKGGTTWLYHILKAKDEVFMPSIQNTSDPSEVRFYDERMKKKISWYRNIYGGQLHKIKGDKPPKYYLLPKYKISLINKLQPNLKIIIILRCPIRRAWSDALMNLKRFNKIDFQGNEEVFEKHLIGKINRGLYYEHLMKWYQVFQKNQIHVIVYEQLIEEPHKHFKQLFDFIGLKNYQIDEKLINTKFNANPSQSIPKAVQELLKPYFVSDVRKLKKEFKHLSFEKWTNFGN